MRVTSQIKTGEDQNPLPFFDIEQTEGKSSHHRTPDSAVDDLIQARRISNVTFNAAHLSDKRSAQPRPFTFIMPGGVDNVAPRGLSIDNEKRHCLRSYPVRDGYQSA